MIHKATETPTDHRAKIIYYHADGAWNYDLAWFRDGKWLTAEDNEDVTYAVEYWADVELPPAKELLSE